MLDLVGNPEDRVSRDTAQCNSKKFKLQPHTGRRGGLVVERRTPERKVGGSIFTQIAVLYP